VSNYWRESARPLTSLVFVAPILLVYEVGIVCLGPQSPRNGADMWLRHLLSFLGLGQYFVLPLLTCSLLLGWHHLTRQRWVLSGEVFSGMLLESALLAVALALVANLPEALFLSVAVDAVAEGPGVMEQIVAFLGAGLYEELLFRLLLLSIAMAVFRALGVDARSAIIGAILIGSFSFAGAHYSLFTSHGEAFAWQSFLFRLVAGAAFSLLYLYRGFGVTVGTHALYDLLVGIS
jgi:hypothetical protein